MAKAGNKEKAQNIWRRFGLRLHKFVPQCEFAVYLYVVTSRILTSILKQELDESVEPRLERFLKVPKNGLKDCHSFSKVFNVNHEFLSIRI